MPMFMRLLFSNILLSFYVSFSAASNHTFSCENNNYFQPFHTQYVNTSQYPHFQQCLKLVNSISQSSHQTWNNITHILFSKHSAHLTLRILVVGGSATRGADCDDGVLQGSQIMIYSKNSFLIYSNVF